MKPIFILAGLALLYFLWRRNQPIGTVGVSAGPMVPGAGLTDNPKAPQCKVTSAVIGKSGPARSTVGVARNTCTLGAGLNVPSGVM